MSSICPTPTASPMLVLLALLITGCVPLPPPTVAAAAPATLPLPDHPLDGAEVVRLAIAHAPALRGERARHGVAAAQLRAAGLLPDPDLTLEGDHPTSGEGAEVDAWSATLSLPLRPFAGRERRREAASAHLKQIDLEVAWQAWQVAAEARDLFVTARTAEMRRRLLADAAAEADSLYHQSQAALASGNLGVTAVADALAATLALEARRDTAARDRADATARLGALLDLPPTTPLHLAEGRFPVPPTPTQVEAAFATVATRRPDLRALAVGARAADARRRAALIARFPPVAVAVRTGRETDTTESFGATLTLRLPLFDGGRGAVATAHAEQERLDAERAARLATTRHETHRLVQRATLIATEQSRLAHREEEARRLMARAEAAYHRHRLPARAYLAAKGALLDLRLRRLDLGSERAHLAIALDTLLARPLGAPR